MIDALFKRLVDMCSIALQCSNLVLSLTQDVALTPVYCARSVLNSQAQYRRRLAHLQRALTSRRAQNKARQLLTNPGPRARLCSEPF